MKQYTTIEVDKELWTRLKHYSVSHETSLKEITDEALRDWAKAHGLVKKTSPEVLIISPEVLDKAQ